MATHSSILAWRIPWTEVGCSPWGHKESDKTEQLTLHSCFTTLYWFILYSKVNQLYVYIYPFFFGFLEGLTFDQREVEEQQGQSPNEDSPFCVCGTRRWKWVAQIEHGVMEIAYLLL